MGRPHLHRDPREPEIIEEVRFENTEALRLLCGERDGNLREIEARFRVTLHPRGNLVRVIGPRSGVEAALDMLRELYAQALSGETLALERAATRGKVEPLPTQASTSSDVVLVTYKNIRLGPKTEGQRQYLKVLAEKDVVFAVGPAGTGKTYLAVLVAVQKLLARQVNRIILARPAVEAGEKLGYLPGDLAEKVNPYLRPLYDALHDMLPFDRVSQMLTTGEIEVAPLAFMRGRTLGNAFVILDEAQNTTPEQMKMFLTRIGEGSRVVVTGDVTQTDLPRQRQSGLNEALRILRNVPAIGVVEFSQRDIVRHPIVQAIIDAYEVDSIAYPTLPLGQEAEHQ